MTRDISGRSRPQAFSGWLFLFGRSRRDLMMAPVFVLAAATVGAIGWCGNVLALPAACLFPALWAFAPTRMIAALVSMAYFLAASRACRSVCRYSMRPTCGWGSVSGYWHRSYSLPSTRPFGRWGRAGEGNPLCCGRDPDECAALWNCRMGESNHSGRRAIPRLGLDWPAGGVHRAYGHDDPGMADCFCCRRCGLGNVRRQVGAGAAPLGSV